LNHLGAAERETIGGETFGGLVRAKLLAVCGADERRRMRVA